MRKYILALSALVAGLALTSFGKTIYVRCGMASYTVTLAPHDRRLMAEVGKVDHSTPGDGVACSNEF